MRGWLAAYATKKDRRPTHLLLSGGKLVVEDGRAGAFLNAYANAVARGEDLYVVEVKTPVFRLFVDLDAKDAPVPDIVVDACTTTAKRRFDNDEVVVFKSTCSLGVHLVFPDIFVTADTAMAYRRDVLHALQMPELEKVFDTAVYGGSGLRMPWSRKRDSPGVYVPTNGDQYPNAHRPRASEVRATLKRCSIRAPEAAPTPHTFEINRETAATSSSAMPMPCIPEPLGRLLLGCLPRAYETSAFTRAASLGRDTIVLKSTSRVCGNLGWKAHNSNTVYFVVHRAGKITQRCYCRCDTTAGRLRGLCKDYASPEFPLPDYLATELFKFEFLPEEQPEEPEESSELRQLLRRTRGLKRGAKRV